MTMGEQERLLECPLCEGCGQVGSDDPELKMFEMANQKLAPGSAAITAIRERRAAGVLPWSHLSNPSQINKMAGEAIDALLAVIDSRPNVEFLEAEIKRLQAERNLYANMVGMHGGDGKQS